jgi:hypothetical protein
MDLQDLLHALMTALAGADQQQQHRPSRQRIRIQAKAPPRPHLHASQPSAMHGKDQPANPSFRRKSYAAEVPLSNLTSISPFLPNEMCTGLPLLRIISTLVT